MVGSRQVTLSVFRQLDWKDWDDVLPMGRVNDNRDADYRTKLLVGRDALDGSLVRCALPPAEDPRGWKEREGRDYLRRQVESWRKTNPWLTYPRVEGTDEMVSYHAWEALAVEWATSRLETNEQRLILVWNTYWKRRTAYDGLPLIILAGLK